MFSRFEKTVIAAGIVGATLLLSAAYARADEVPTPAVPEAATPTCKLYEEITKDLEDKFKEKSIGYGLDFLGTTVFELFASTETGTWTLLGIRPDNRACVVTFGSSWNSVVGSPI